MINLRLTTLLCLLLQPAWLLAETFDARLDWTDVHIISVPIEGIIDAVQVQPGQRVKQGDLLLQLSQTPHRYRLQQAQAAVDAIEPQREDALREKNDAEALYEQTVLSDVELQAAQLLYRKLDAEWRRAKAALKLAQWRLGWTQVRAPRDTVVIARDISPGQMIAGDVRSKPLLRLASPHAMLATAAVPVKRLATLKPGDAVSVEVDGKRYSASIERMALHTDADGKAKLSARFETTQPMLAGQSAKLALP